MKVKRVTLTSGVVSEVTFEGSFCGKWLVKNFSSGDIYASFDEDFTENNAIKIGSECGQVVIDNEYLGGLQVFKHDTIYLSGEGEIEVQQLCYHN